MRSDLFGGASAALSTASVLTTYPASLAPSARSSSTCVFAARPMSRTSSDGASPPGTPAAWPVSAAAARAANSFSLASCVDSHRDRGCVIASTGGHTTTSSFLASSLAFVAAAPAPASRSGLEPSAVSL
eukprot:31303-Pelagococcus_subviridis.AAC.27